MQDRKKKRLKKTVRWLLVDIAVTCIILALLLYKPSGYRPPEVNPADHKKGQIHPYLTHLSAELYNNSQLERPFELVVLEGQINEAIRFSDWQMESEGVKISEPVVLFEPEKIVLMGKANVKGADLIVTIMVKPDYDQQGLLNLKMSKLKIGAMNVTPLAKVIAKKMYKDRLAAGYIDTEDLRTKIAASLLTDEPFEPVFRIDDEEVRIDKITVEKGRLILRLVPH